jgi:diaminopimelate decarboxylase
VTSPLPEPDPPVDRLAEIARQHTTPAYVYDLQKIRTQAARLKQFLPQVPGSLELYYSLKANASLGLCDVLADCGLGADVASAGELATAVEAGFPAARIFAAGPYKSPEMLEQLGSLPDAVVSVDSVSELASLARADLPNKAVLRLRPDFGSAAVVQAGPDSRFGVTIDDLPACRELLDRGGPELIGFHVFAGSQVLETDAVIAHLQGAVDLSLKAADVLGITPRLINVGGGFGVPYCDADSEVDLERIGEALDGLLERVAPGRLALELGRFLVAQAGWYLVSVVGHQSHQGRPAVVVDGGTHQRADLCGLQLSTRARPPLVLGSASAETRATDVLGCLSLPADVLASECPLPPMETGIVLAFADAGAYGLWSSPALFHGSPLPAEVAFDSTTIPPTISLMRSARPARSILDDQAHVLESHVHAETN